MVALEAPPPLPTLSQEDAALLERYWSLDEDLAALAAERTEPRAALLAWSLRPDVRAWIAAARQHERERHLRLAEMTLAALARTTEDPIEKRRAAATLLRAFRPPSPPGGGAERSEAERAPSSSSLSNARQPLAHDPDALADEDEIEDDHTNEEPILPLPKTIPTPGEHLGPEELSKATLQALRHAQHPVPDAYKLALYTLCGYDPAKRTRSAVDHIAGAILQLARGVLHHRSATPGPIVPRPAGWAQQFVQLQTLDGRALRLELAFRHEHNPHDGPCWTLKRLLARPNTS